MSDGDRHEFEDMPEAPAERVRVIVDRVSTRSTSTPRSR